MKTHARRYHRPALYEKAACLGLLVCACCALRPRWLTSDRIARCWNDAKLYVHGSAALGIADNWAYFGGTIFAIGIAHEFDMTARHAFEPTGGQPLDGQDPNSTRDAIPALALLAGTWAFGARLTRQGPAP